MASGRVERIKEMRNQIPGHRLRYYADAVDAGLSIEDVKAGRFETWMGVAKADLLRERDEARAERDDAKEWVHHATRMANERDEAQAERDDLADALRQLERLATAVAGDAPTEARYGSLWSDLRRAAAEARKVLDKHDGKTERNES